MLSICDCDLLWEKGHCRWHLIQVVRRGHPKLAGQALSPVTTVLPVPVVQKRRRRPPRKRPRDHRGPDWRNAASMVIPRRRETPRGPEQAGRAPGHQPGLPCSHAFPTPQTQLLRPNQAQIAAPRTHQKSDVSTCRTCIPGHSSKQSAQPAAENQPPGRQGGQGVRDPPTEGPKGGGRGRW